ncbi:MAG: 4Fe-4S dicluster domain-containing protein [Anaerolineae bacterium]|nr:4Fe-4S dicluster domain-containing protein [Anaerolineae bacterium]
MPDNGTGESFLERIVAATPGGEALVDCLQCGTCGGSCPSAADMDTTPRGLFAMISAGMEDEVLSSNTPWYCVSCYYCMVRCPQEIPITSIMYTLKRIALARGHYHKDAHVDWSKSFISFVEQNGRAFELGAMTLFGLHNPFAIVKQGGLGIQMITKGRMPPIPERIHNMPQLNAILAEAKRIAAEEEV